MLRGWDVARWFVEPWMLPRHLMMKDSYCFSDRITIVDADEPRGIYWARGRKFPWLAILVDVVTLRAAGHTSARLGETFYAEVAWKPNCAEAYQVLNDS
jgi:hypothetical protein